MSRLVSENHNGLHGYDFLMAANPLAGVAHEAERDFEFQGYLVPKGTRILPLDL